MKKKLALCLALVLALALVGTIFAACGGGMSDEELTKLINTIERDYKDMPKVTNEAYGLPTSTKATLESGKELESSLKWTSSNPQITIGSTPNLAGYYPVSLPDRQALNADAKYTLTATLINDSGKEYTKKDGSTYSYSFDRKVTIEGEFSITFDSKDKASGDGEAMTWTEGGVTVVAQKAYSPTDSANYVSPARFYQNSSIKVTTTTSFKSMLIRLDDYNNGQYVKGFDGMGVDGATIERIDTDAVWVVLDEPGTEFQSDILAAQTRIISIDFFTTKDPGLTPQTRYTTPEEIWNALQALGSGQTLPGGRYSLTGTITEIPDDGKYSDNYKNISFYMDLEFNGQNLYCYRIAGGKELKVGDKVTVTGLLVDYNGTKEFSGSCTYVLVQAAE